MKKFLLLFFVLSITLMNFSMQSDLSVELHFLSKSLDHLENMLQEISARDIEKRAEEQRKRKEEWKRLQQEAEAEKDKEIMFSLEAIGGPSSDACGASVKKGNIIVRMTDVDQIECMFQGYKKVYYGSIGILQTVESIRKRKYPQSSLKFDYIVLTSGSILLFTPEGRKQAELYATLEKEDNLLRHNTYLFGKILGYKEEDIEYFYIRNAVGRQRLIEDKTAADAYFAKHLPELLNE